MKTQEVLSEDEKIEVVDGWNARRPVKPDAPKPVLKQTDVIYGIAMPIAALGFLAGFIFLMLAASNTTDMKETLLLIGFVSIIVLPLGLPVAYAIGLTTLEDVRRFIYRRRMVKTGWGEYEQQLAIWRKEAASFSRWLANDYVYSIVIKASQDD